MATARKAESMGNGFAALFKVSDFNYDALIDAHRKNVEALIEANRVAFEGYKTASEKQVAHLRDAVDEASGTAREILNGKTPEVNANKQVEAMQGFARKGFDAMREISELTLSANREAFSVMQKRMAECMEELKETQEKTTAAAAKASK